MNEISGIHHASMLVSDLSRSLQFYVDVLGIEIDPSRPQMPFEGAWLRVGDQQIHLLQLPSPDPVAGRPEHAGRDRHTALTVRDLDAVVARLEKAGVVVTQSRSGRRASFCHDPDGNGIELIENG